MSEVWKPIVGCEGRYEVSDQGRIRTVERINVMNYAAGHQQTRKIAAKVRSLSWVGDSSKYLGCLVVDNSGRRRFLKAHVEALRAFVGERPGAEFDGCHNDGDPSNNRLTNLRWDTKSSNNKDKAVHGTDQKGERNATSKLTEADVLHFKAIMHSKTLNELSQMFGISIARASKIRRGEAWEHV